VNRSTITTVAGGPAQDRHSINPRATLALALALASCAALSCGAGGGGQADEDGYDVAGAAPGGKSQGSGSGLDGAKAPGPRGPTAEPVTAPYGILFVTQVPVAGFNVVTSTFGNHGADVRQVPRGGDLWARYDDGTLRNLTAEAGFGEAGQQGAKAIAVREPSVHWGGRKALFSMLVGAPAQQYGSSAGFRWQIYEIEGLQKGEAARVTKVANQPAGYDNVAPFYGTDDRVLFVSTRPRAGEAHLYPQLDEYESAPTTVGLYSLDPASGDLFLVNHAPSGAFSPFIDSAGRVVFTKWDHLQRDQQEEYDRLNGTHHGAFDFGDESAGASHLAPVETFPQARTAADPHLGAGETPLVFNQFFPWQVREDGAFEETLNHVGRQEFGGSFTPGSFSSDPNLVYQTPPSAHENRVYIKDAGGLFQMAEDPTAPGTFYATNSAEFATETSGQIVRFTGADGMNPDQMVITEITPGITRETLAAATNPAHTGHYRDLLPRANGQLVVSHTSEVRVNANDGSPTAPAVRYAFRLKALERNGATFAAGAPLTPGIRKAITWWSPEALASWEGDLWELDAVELRSRPRPLAKANPLPAPERSIFEQEGVNEAALRGWLAARSLALIVSRDVTSRDRGDVQQPFNLRVPGGVESIAAGGKVYDVAGLQLFQADSVRGYSDRQGRRPLARPMHDAGAAAYLEGAGAPGTAKVAADGSVATFVPARRAMSWQLVGAQGEPVVRERNWVSFAPGEVRVCASCHGVNTGDQLDRPAPENPPEALRSLLRAWKEDNGG
jgi:hydrazine synthase alpha subunit-like protein